MCVCSLEFHFPSGKDILWWGVMDGWMRRCALGWVELGSRERRAYVLLGLVWISLCGV